MKSINQILGHKQELIDTPEVQELIEYCRELESEVMETRSKEQYSKEDKLAELIRDVYNSIQETIKMDEEAIRFKETDRVDYEECFLNLKIYIQNFSRDNRFRL